MAEQRSIEIRAKKLGILLRDARIAAGKSMKDCSNVIGVSSYMIGSFEKGENSPSLPQLEGLAYYLDVPLEHFWGEEVITGMDETRIDRSNLERLIPLRQRIIGAKLRKTRQETGTTMGELAETVGVTTYILRSYERGERPIPLPELEVMAQELETPIDEFKDQDGVVGQWAAQQRAIHQFMELPPEIQEFVSKPINSPYLELAKRLSEMPVGKLRSVAEGLLEITL